MHRFRRMHKDRRRASTAEGGGDLLPHQAGFAQPADDDLARMRQNCLGSAHEGLIDAPDRRLQGVSLVHQRPPGHVQPVMRQLEGKSLFVRTFDHRPAPIKARTCSKSAATSTAMGR